MAARRSLLLRGGLLERQLQNLPVVDALQRRQPVIRRAAAAVVIGFAAGCYIACVIRICLSSARCPLDAERRRQHKRHG
jgi:hypothetical protein